MRFRRPRTCPVPCRTRARAAVSSTTSNTRPPPWTASTFDGRSRIPRHGGPRTAPTGLRSAIHARFDALDDPPRGAARGYRRPSRRRLPRHAERVRRRFRSSYAVCSYTGDTRRCYLSAPRPTANMPVHLCRTLHGRQRRDAVIDTEAVSTGLSRSFGRVRLTTLLRRHTHVYAASPGCVTPSLPYDYCRCSPLRSQVSRSENRSREPTMRNRVPERPIGRWSSHES